MFEQPSASGQTEHGISYYSCTALDSMRSPKKGSSYFLRGIKSLLLEGGEEVPCVRCLNFVNSVTCPDNCTISGRAVAEVTGAALETVPW